MNTLTDERLEREFKVTEKVLNEVKINNNKDMALKFLDTAKRYYEDAKFFKEKNDKASAWGALNYAHGWLDAGKEIGLFEVKK